MDVPTAEQLVELVHRFYPANRYSSEPEYRQSAELQRLLEARALAAKERAQPWGELLRRLRGLLPAATIWDLTYLGQDNCHRVRVYLQGTPADAAQAVTACVSVLAPVFLLFTSHERREGGVNLPSRTFYEARPETAQLERLLDSNIQAVFGFVRVPAEVLFTPVPDIQCGNVALGEATLADCLFTHDRW
jgi:hypothetical protein